MTQYLPSRRVTHQSINEQNRLARLLAPHILFLFVFIIINGLITCAHAQLSNTDQAQSSALPLPDQGPMLSSETGVRAGQWSFAFSVPFGGDSSPGFDEGVSSIGVWKMVTDELSLGLLGGLKISTEEVDVGTDDQGGPAYTETKERVSSELILSPSLKFYTYQKGPVALFFIAQTHLRLFSDGDQATTTDKEPSLGETYSPEEELQLRARLGFGSEWFATPSFSLAGHIGLQLDLLRQGDLGMGLETFTSALSAQIYF